MVSQVVVAPDGCCLDADRALWVADGMGNRVIRVRHGGEIAGEIHTGTGVFACMLGGADGRTLFACTAPDFAEEARKQAREASLVAARVDTPPGGAALTRPAGVTDQVAAQECELRGRGLLVAFQERSVVPAGQPDQFGARSPVRRGDGWRG